MRDEDGLVHGPEAGLIWALSIYGRFHIWLNCKLRRHCRHDGACCHCEGGTEKEAPCPHLEFLESMEWVHYLEWDHLGCPICLNPQRWGHRDVCPVGKILERETSGDDDSHRLTPAPSWEAMRDRVISMRARMEGSSSTPFEDVRKFHKRMRVPIRKTPGFPDDERVELRLGWIEEEWDELKDAVKQRDLAETADALGDIVYVVHGMALELGVPFDEVWDEIHRSNMDKVPSGGKAIKPDGWTPPKVAEILDIERLRSP